MRWFEKKNKNYYSGQLEQELSGLYPGVNRKRKVREYYQKKTESAIRLGIAGVLIVLLYMFKHVTTGNLENERYLERRPVGGGNREIALNALLGDEIIEDVVITVGEREISEEAKRELLKDVEECLEEIIKGDNEGLDYVNKPLNLITGWEDTDVFIDWTSSNYGILKEDGSFGTDKIPESGIEVILTAFVSLDEMQKEKNITVTVFPEEKSAEEIQKAELTKFVSQREKSSRAGEYFELPVNFRGNSIRWEEQREGLPLIIVLFPFVGVVAALWGKDRDIHKQYEERNRQLSLEYSEFVSKLQLLVGAGMSLRNAFIKLGMDYQKRRNAGGKKRFVYEEVIMMVRKLENGASEEEAYDYFAKRCTQICYRKLVSIIIQNQKKGTEGLKESLLTETRNAFEERKQEAERLGEEAGTKLLLPMMMMMGVVLMIIVIPVYFSFGGI